MTYQNPILMELDIRRITEIYEITMAEKNFLIETYLSLVVYVAWW